MKTSLPIVVVEVNTLVCYIHTMVSWKRVFVSVAVAGIVLTGIRYYVLDMSVKALGFGCDTAATKVYRFYDKDLGRKLFVFCDAYTDNVHREFFGGFR